MKFRLKFRNKALHKGSGHSIASGKKHNRQQEITTVESWNELRTIGYESKKPQNVDPKEEGEEQEPLDVTLREVQDWDYYIAEFNRQYRRQLQQPDTDRDKDSISTIADTRSQLLRSRHRRMLVYRKCFISSCFLLWAISFFGGKEWYLTYLIYPTGFLHETDSSIYTRYFTPSAVWYAFVLNAHSWFVGSTGFLCASCFRENPQVLRQFILRVPYILIIPSSLIWISVRFIGSLSSKKLEDAMNNKIPEYHNFDDDEGTHIRSLLDADKNGRRLWDQLQKILQCCGVTGARDWDSVDTDLSDEISYLPTTCCPPSFVRLTWTKERPGRDDCYHKLNKQYGTDEYEWAFPYGCLNLAYEFFVKRGAFIVGLMVANFCALCLCLAFAFNYYVMIRKSEDLRFKYSMKEWFSEIFFLEKFWWVKTICIKMKCCKRKKAQEEMANRKTVISSQHSQTSADSNVLAGPNVYRIPSVIITAPKLEEEEQLQDAEADNQSMKVLFIEEHPEEEEVVNSETTPLFSVVDETARSIEESESAAPSLSPEVDKITQENVTESQGSLRFSIADETEEQQGLNIAESETTITYFSEVEETENTADEWETDAPPSSGLEDTDNIIKESETDDAAPPSSGVEDTENIIKESETDDAAPHSSKKKRVNKKEQDKKKK